MNDKFDPPSGNDERFNSYPKSVKVLAACIKLAYIEAGHNMDPENEVYWYTRELCAQKVRESSGSVIELMTCAYLFPLTGLSKQDRCDLLIAAGDAWFDVVHPDLLVRGVLSE